MKRDAFVRTIGGAAGLAAFPAALRPAVPAGWPPQSAWDALNAEVGGNLIRVRFPLDACRTTPNGAACAEVLKDIRDPYYVGDEPGLTQTLGWVDAWQTSPSVYAVAARNAHDVAAAVNFARERGVKLVVKGGGHSYQGTSNAANSLLIWTRRMHEVALHDDAVTVEAGATWGHVYDAVTTKAGRYVQGGGCTTVGVAGLVSSGGFGSFSKRYGTAASSLLEAEVVTADGAIRTVNASSDPDLYWALKGGGGGSFGVITKLTLRLHDLADSWGGADMTIVASSDDAYRALVRRFVAFYRDALFNDRWGEQAHFAQPNTLRVSMVFAGIDGAAARALWKPFVDWVLQSPQSYAFESGPDIGSMPSRHWWDPFWSAENGRRVFKTDWRTGADPANVWWNGDAGQVAFYINGYESLWLPQTLLDDDAQAKLAGALFAGSRSNDIELHFNKGLAGAPPEAIAAAADTATNPSVVTSFALAIVGDAQGPAYPGIPGHEPDVAAGRAGRASVRRAMEPLRALAPDGGAYVSESDYFQPDFRRAYWGTNAPRLAAVKRRYDPAGLFTVHNGID